MKIESTMRKAFIDQTLKRTLELIFLSSFLIFNFVTDNFYEQANDATIAAIRSSLAQSLPIRRIRKKELRSIQLMKTNQMPEELAHRLTIKSKQCDFFFIIPCTRFYTLHTRSIRCLVNRSVSLSVWFLLFFLYIFVFFFCFWFFLPIPASVRISAPAQSQATYSGMCTASIIQINKPINIDLILPVI